MTKNEWTGALVFGGLVILAIGTVLYEVSQSQPEWFAHATTRLFRVIIIMGTLTFAARCIVNIFKLGSDHED